MTDEQKIILSDAATDPEVPKPRVTLRSKERAREEQDYVPVIIKRSDEVSKHPDDVLESAIREGLEQLNRPFISLLLSAIAAGLILGFAALLVAFVSQLMPADSPILLRRLAMAAVYPLGFVICVISGTQLFTEHTATSVYPVLDHKSTLRRLFKLWGIVLLGNLLGTFLSSFLLFLTQDITQVSSGYLTVAKHMLEANNTSLFLSALLAGWLMAQGAWLVLSTPPSSSQIFCIYIVTFIIGVGGFHHSIAGSAELFTAMWITNTISLAAGASFLCLVILGNLVGGSMFVALLNYAHIRKTQVIEY